MSSALPPETDEATPARFKIADIHPIPDDETLAAITAALDAAWPEPTQSVSGNLSVQTSWRFGLRPWASRPIPRQTWGRQSVKR